jgi:probable HAF family extracellular repeat protein
LATICLLFWLVPAFADPPDDGCYPDSPFGNGGTGDLLEIFSGQTYDVASHENWRNVYIHAGGILDTHGYRLRVCDTLTNYGEITDSTSGGVCGASSPADGQDFCEDSGGPPEAEDGTRNCACVMPLYPQAGGSGLCGGGGGGGGGAALIAPECYDANGGAGGAGGDGGKGGGYVRIYAYRLDNQGLIQADGQPGEPGGNGRNGEYILLGPSPKDFASGGGGGGAGGSGGHGGTVLIYFNSEGLLNAGTTQALGGLGGTGGDGGVSGTTLHGGPLECLDNFYEVDGPGGQGAPPPPETWRGGDGGDGEHQLGEYAGDGQPGAIGSAGGNGLVQLVPIPPPGPAWGYALTDIGPGAYPQAINEAGWVVGYAETPFGYRRAFLWLGDMWDLGTLGGDDSWAYDVNELVEVVGRSELAAGQQAPYCAFLWPLFPPVCGYPPEPRLISLGVLPGCGPNSWAFAINDATSIAGWSGSDPENDGHAFLWLCEPACGLPVGMNDIHPPDYWTRSVAFDINNDDDVVMWAHYRFDTQLWLGARLWKCDSGSSESVFFRGVPRGFNDNGDMVGFHGTGVLDPIQVTAFLCRPDTEWDCDWLPALPGGEDCLANAVSDACDVVGWSETPMGTHHACLWRNRIIYDLNHSGPAGGGGACCFYGLTCLDDVSESWCVALGGRYSHEHSCYGDYPPPPAQPWPQMVPSCDVEPLGACCFEGDGMDPPQCVDDWDELSCIQLGAHRWVAWTTCADLEPPCGTGACCHVDGTCTYTTHVDCTAPDEWLGYGVDCDSCDHPDSDWVLTEATDINEVGQIVGSGYLNGEAHGFLLTPCPCPGFVKADTNCDGAVNNFDIAPFVQAVLNPPQYAIDHPGCNWLCVADINCDGAVNNFDITPFVECVLNGGCP